jgi:hypothetical protein
VSSRRNPRARPREKATKTYIGGEEEIGLTAWVRFYAALLYVVKLTGDAVLSYVSFGSRWVSFCVLLHVFRIRCRIYCSFTQSSIPEMIPETRLISHNDTPALPLLASRSPAT